jgi:hypothetical protein
MDSYPASPRLGKIRIEQIERGAFANVRYGWKADIGQELLKSEP